MESGLIIPGFFSSPGDAIDLRVRAIEHALEWNLQNTLHDWATVQPVTGRIARAAYGDHPQAIINKLIRDCDFLIAVFQWELGTPTNTAESGTVEEIETFNEKHGGERLCIYFSNVIRPPHDEPKMREIHRKEYNRLCDYRASIQGKCYYRQFDNDKSFEEQLRFDINSIMRELVTNARKASPVPVPPPIVPESKLSASYSSQSNALYELLTKIGHASVAATPPSRELEENRKIITLAEWINSRANQYDEILGGMVQRGEAKRIAEICGTFRSKLKKKMQEIGDEWINEEAFLHLGSLLDFLLATEQIKHAFNLAQVLADFRQQCQDAVKLLRSEADFQESIQLPI
jgi:hypothetical protein